MVSREQRSELVAAMLRGEVTPVEVSRALSVSKQAVFRWIDAADASGAREHHSRQIIAAIMLKHSPDALTRGRRTIQEPDTMRPVAQKNEFKAFVLRRLKRGEMTIEQAAKKADVPRSGIIGWMKLAKLPIPDEPEPTTYKRKPVRAPKLTTEAVRFILEKRRSK